MRGDGKRCSKNCDRDDLEQIIIDLWKKEKKAMDSLPKQRGNQIKSLFCKEINSKYKISKNIYF